LADEIQIIIRGNSAEGKAALASINKSLKETEGQTKKTGGVLKNFKENWVSITAILGTTVLAMKKMVGDAIDLQETTNKFNVTFKGVEKNAESMAKTLQNSYGLSIRASKEMLASTGDLLNGLGFTKDASLDLSGTVQKLAVDLDSFQNLQGGATRASEILTKAVLGERDALVSLGIKISEDDLKQRALAEGIELVNGKMSRQEQAMITLALITEQSKNAVGDFGRSQESLANLTKVMNSAFEDASASIGTAFLPLISKIVKVITVVVKAFTALPGPVKTAAVVIVGAFGAAVVAAKLFNTTLWANPIIAIVAAIVAGVVLIVANWEKISDKVKEVFLEMEILAAETTAKVSEKFSALQDKWMEIVNTMREAVGMSLLATGEEFRENVNTIIIEKKRELKELKRMIKEREAAEKKANATLQGMESNFKKQKDKNRTAESKADQQRQTERQMLNKKAEDAMTNYSTNSSQRRVDAVIDAAADEKATIGSVAASLIRSEGFAMSKVLAVRAAAALASGNVVAAGTLAAAAAGVLLLSRSAAAALEGGKGFQQGGVIDEPVVGFGTRTGRAFTFGEAGPETVTPGRPEDEGAAGEGRGDIIFQIETLNVQADNAEEFVESMDERLGLRTARR